MISVEPSGCRGATPCRGAAASDHLLITRPARPWNVSGIATARGELRATLDLPYAAFVATRMAALGT
ncbi:hypothetical protein [Agromyces cerinus]|uniref:hypothetical protein n=1 Tax=Agromyces cerinus TaxID=33878 RepID=UPI00094122AA|nr:hypothetical protein [Agromyces cerinus]